MKKTKLFAIAIAVTCIGFLGLTIFRNNDQDSLQAASPKETPLNCIHDLDAKDISVARAKEIFDLSFKDVWGTRKIYQGKFTPGHHADTLAEVFKREKDPETRFYLGRTMIIQSFDLEVSSIRKTDKLRAMFQGGYKIIQDLAKNSYGPAQEYLGYVTLEPKFAFAPLHLDRIRLFRVIPGADGNVKPCQRVIFTRSKKELRQATEDSAAGGLASFMNEYNRQSLFRLQPHNNGYGISYGLAVTYLENSVRRGSTKALKFLINYFDNMVRNCGIVDVQEQLPIARKKLLLYKRIAAGESMAML